MNYLIWTFDMICYLIHQFDTTSQICFLAMKVTWPCHWCTNGMTLVWLSDVPHRPLLIWYAHFMNCYGYYIWFVGAYGCILDLLFVSRYISWLHILVWWLMVCAIHVFHIIWEWQLQPLRHPLMLHLVSRGHPSGYIIFGLIWFGLVVDYYSLNLLLVLVY